MAVMKVVKKAALAVALVAGAAGAQECTELSYAPQGLGEALRTNPNGACNAQGVCELGRCECREGWSSRADFLDVTGVDCPINNMVLRIMWGFNLAFALVNSARAVPKIILRWQQHQDKMRAYEGTGPRMSIRNNRGLLACLAYILVCFPGMVGMGITYLVDPEQRIGLDVAPTVFFAVTKTGFYLAVWLFQPALLSSILKGKTSTRHLVKVNDRASFALCFFAGVLGFAPFLTLLLSDGRDTLALAVYYVLMAGTLLQLTLLGIQAQYVKRKVISVLERSFSLTKSARVEKMKDRLVAVQKENIVQTIIQGIVYSVYVVWPFMFTKHAYFLPIGWLAMALLGKKVAFTTLRDTRYGTHTGTDTESNSKSRGMSKEQSRTNTRATTMLASTHVDGGKWDLSVAPEDIGDVVVVDDDDDDRFEEENTFASEAKDVVADDLGRTEQRKGSSSAAAAAAGEGLRKASGNSAASSAFSALGELAAERFKENVVSFHDGGNHSASVDSESEDSGDDYV